MILNMVPESASDAGTSDEQTWNFYLEGDYSLKTYICGVGKPGLEGGRVGFEEFHFYGFIIKLYFARPI